MKSPIVLAVVVMACIDTSSAWRVNLYKGGDLNGSKATAAGSGTKDSACHKIKNFKGANLAGKVGSIEYSSYDSKHHRLCDAYFYVSSNCKGSYGDAYQGYGSFQTTGSSRSKYHSMRTRCRTYHAKRSELELGQDLGIEGLDTDIDEEDVEEPLVQADSN